MLNPQLTRREFLKLASAGTLAFALKDLRADSVLAATVPKHGRITWSGIPLYDAPTFKANKLSVFRADEVLEITSIDENGEPGNPYNSAWYQINGEGYTYSGWIPMSMLIMDTAFFTAQHTGCRELLSPRRKKASGMRSMIFISRNLFTSLPMICGLYQTMN